MLEAEFESEVAMSLMLPQVPHSPTEAGITVHCQVMWSYRASRRGLPGIPDRKASARGSLRDERQASVSQSWGALQILLQGP